MQQQSRRSVQATDESWKAPRSPGEGSEPGSLEGKGSEREGLSLERSLQDLSLQTQ